MAEEQEVAAIPLVEERVQISKRQVETGRLRVRVTVGEREEAVPVSLDHDEVEVRRVPRGIPLASIPSVRIEGNVTVIPWSRKSPWSRSG
jgi:stress response protein YsnF